MAFCPEANLLVAISRTRVDQQYLDIIQELLAQTVNWHRLRKFAGVHRVFPLLYWHLKDIESEYLPEEQLESLKRTFYLNIGRNLYLSAELARITRLFDEQGIVSVPFRGPIIAQRAYQNIGLRQAGDLDFLIHSKDGLRVQQLLIQQGYQQVAPGALTANQELAFIQFSSERCYIKLSPRAEIDIHWDLFKKQFRLPFDLGYFHNRLITAKIDNQEYQVFDVESMLLLLCLHGSKHNWSRLQWICDIAEILHSDIEIDWDKLLKEVKRLNVERMFYLGILVAHDLLGAPLPEAIPEKNLTDDFLQSRLVSIYDNLFSDPLEIKQDVLSERRALREKWQDRAAYFIYQLFTPTHFDIQMLNLPKRLFWVYSIVRLLRLVGLPKDSEN